MMLRLFVLSLLCACAAAGEPSGVPEPDANPLFAKFETTEGSFVIEVNPSWSPVGAEHFLRLVRAKYYDGQKVFRMIPNFLVQFGYNPDPEITSRFSKTIKDDPFKVSNYKGYVAFAGSHKDSRSTHVFINLADNFFIDHRDIWATPFGRVITGFDVVTNFFSGYQRHERDGGPTPQQGSIAREGNAYLEKNFPLLSEIKTVRLVQMPPPPHDTAKKLDRRNEEPDPIPRLAAVTMKPFPDHWGKPPNLNPESREDDVKFPHGYGHGSNAAAKWIRLNERMDVIAEEEKGQEARKAALLQGSKQDGGSQTGGNKLRNVNLREVMSEALEADKDAAKAVVNNLGNDLLAAEHEIEHDSPIMVILAGVGAIALLWIVYTQCARIPKAKE